MPLSSENTSLFVMRIEKFSETTVSFDFSFNWSRVKFVWHFHSILLARVSESFEPVWHSASSSISISLNISAVDYWFLVDKLVASSTSVSFEELTPFFSFNACCCCSSN